MSLLRKFSPCQESPVTAAMRWTPRTASTGGLPRGKRRAKGTKVWSPAFLGLCGLLLHVLYGGCSCWGFTGWSWGSWSILEFVCAHRNAKGLVTCKSAGTWSQELCLHKGRAWGMKSEPESSVNLANVPQPWKTNTAIPNLCNFATGCVASLNVGWWQQVCLGVEVLLSMMQLLAKHKLCFQCVYKAVVCCK